MSSKTQSGALVLLQRSKKKLLPTIRKVISQKFFRSRTSLIIGLIILLCLNQFGVLKSAIDFAGHASIRQRNETYAREEAEKTFLVLSALKTGLSVLESANGGMSLTLWD